MSGFVATPVTLASGLRLNALDWPGQEGSGRAASPLLLIHGLGDAAVVWRDVARTLSRSCRVLSVDMRGHGRSDWAADGDYSPRTMAADVAELCQILGLDSLVAAGHSMGASVALRLAASRPDLVRKLVLCDFGAAMNPDQSDMLVDTLLDAHRDYASVGEYADVLAARHPVASPDLVQWLAAETTMSGSGAVRLRYDPALLSSKRHDGARQEESWRLMAALERPVLVQRGIASSVLSARTAERMARQIPDAKLAVIPMAGHSVHVDNPPAVTEGISRFCSG